MLCFIAVPNDQLQQLRTYKVGDCEDVQALFQDFDLTYVQVSRLSLMAYRAANADGELHSKEI